MRRGLVLRSILLTTAIAGCVGDDPPGASSTSSTSSSSSGGTTPGGDGGTNPGTDGGGTPEAGTACDPTSAPACSSDATQLVACSPEGTTLTTNCLLGCDAAQKRCKQIVASGVAGSVDVSTATKKDALDIADTIWVETDTGFMTRRQAGAPFGSPIRAAGTGVKDGIGYELKDQTGGPKLAVFTFEKLTIGKDTIVRATGDAAVAFVARDGIVIEGKLSVRGDCAAATPLPGPGGYKPREPGGNNITREESGNPYLCGGGGGGGNGDVGRNGGNAVFAGRTGGGGLSGPKRAATLIVTPLLTGGGGGGNFQGGPGGGALQLVTSGAIDVSGVIDAGGCGGRKALINGASPNTCGGAGGGGAGGTIFFEAPVVRVAASGRVLANGGGGGGGTNGSSTSSTTTGNDASDVDATAAKGGTATSTGGLTCGNASDGSPFTGGNFTGQCDGNTSAVQASGGGGGPGHIAARTKDGTVVITTGGIVSPAAVRDFAVTK